MKKALQGVRILVVEDDPDLLAVISSNLELCGATTHSAENGFWAFEILLSQEVDVILSDYRMPGCDGKTLLGNVRKRDSKAPIFLFLTGYADLTDDEALALGASGILHKPFELNRLVKIIAELAKPQNAA